MSYCGENCLSRYEERNLVAVSLRCRAWTCPDCEPARKSQLIAQCHRGAPCTFLTLTLRRIPGKDRNKAALELTRAWRLLRLRILRKYKWKKLPFAAVMEAHQSGWPHLHILLRTAWIDGGWISEQMQEIADSPVIKIKHIDNRGRVSAYVAKYCSKSAHKFGTAKRYFFSRDYDLQPEATKESFSKTKYRWERQTQTLELFAKSLAVLGFSVSWLSTRKFQASKPP